MYNFIYTMQREKFMKYEGNIENESIKTINKTVNTW